MTSVESLFKDLVVIEIANVLAGPAVGMFFAELGATVIKVENPATGGDTTRQWKLPSESADTDVSGYFSCVNWGKKSIGIDFQKPEGRAVLIDLVQTADIFLQSLKPGDDQKFQLDYPTLMASNDRLIYADITAFGSEDDRVGFDAVIQAETGYTGMNGTKDSGPVKMPVALIDILLAHQLKAALLLALFERTQTGKGSYVTVSLFQSGLTALANQAANFLVGKTVPQRTGSDHPNIVPYGTIFLSKEGEGVVLAVGTDGQFRALCQNIGQPDLSSDKRFHTNQQRVKHRETLNTILADCISTWDRDTLLKKLRSHHVPAGAVRMMDEVLNLPQTAPLLLEGLLEDGQPIQGLRTIAFKGSFIDRAIPMAPPPSYNQHAVALLRDHLGYTEERISQLRVQSVIG